MSKKLMPPIYAEFGARVRLIRETLGVDRDRLAAELDLSTSSISAIERGDQTVSLHQAAVLARALGTSLERLLAGLWSTPNGGNVTTGGSANAE